MKIGINNIVTILYFSFLFFGSGGLGVMIFMVLDADMLYGSEKSEFFLLLFASLFFSLIAFIIGIFIIKKFRFVYITHNQLVIIKPFLLKKEVFDLNKIKKVNFKTNYFLHGESKGLLHRICELKFLNYKASVEISDFELDNFDYLIEDFNDYDRENKFKIDLEQAKENLLDFKINLIILLPLFLLCLWIYFKVSYYHLFPLFSAFFFLLLSVRYIFYWRKSEKIINQQS